jgi:hypothetical protein
VIELRASLFAQGWDDLPLPFLLPRTTIIETPLLYQI